MKQKNYLSPTDLMRLDAARDGKNDGGRLPSVKAYNDMIEAGDYLGKPIRPFGWSEEAQ